MERKFGYARVSTEEQNLDRQILALREYVKEENIIVDKASGKNFQKTRISGIKRRYGIKERRYIIHNVT